MEEIQNPTAWTRFKDFVKECVRVVKVTKKPTMQEYKVVLAVTGLGILIIGLIGFLVTMIRQLVS